MLRRFTSADVDALAALHGDAEVMRYIDDAKPVPRRVVETETLPAILREYGELPDGLGQFAVLAPDIAELAERSSDRFAGWVSLKPATSVGLAPDDIELGYRILPSHWGRGLATAASVAMLDRGFGELGLDRVVATTMAVNTGSRRVMAKAGLRHVRTFHVDWPDPIPGTEHGEVVYAITKDEWSAARGTH